MKSFTWERDTFSYNSAVYFLLPLPDTAGLLPSVTQSEIHPNTKPTHQFSLTCRGLCWSPEERWISSIKSSTQAIVGCSSTTGGWQVQEFRRHTLHEELEVGVNVFGGKWFAIGTPGALLRQVREKIQSKINVPSSQLSLCHSQLLIEGHHAFRWWVLLKAAALLY